MSDTSGFYKNDNGNLLYAASAVIGAEIHLIRELKDTYEYPVAGWKWFDSEDLARTEYNIPAPPPPEPTYIAGINPNINVIDPSMSPPPFPYKPGNI